MPQPLTPAWARPEWENYQERADGVYKIEGDGWVKLKSGRDKNGDPLVNEGGKWRPMPVPPNSRFASTGNENSRAAVRDQLNAQDVNRMPDWAKGAAERLSVLNNGLGWGASDEIVGGLSAATALLETGSPEQAKAVYGDAVAFQKGNYKDAYQKRPLESAATEISGGVIGTFGPASKLGWGKGGAVVGGAYGVGTSNYQDSLTESLTGIDVSNDGTLKDYAMGGVEGAITGAAIGKTMQGVGNSVIIPAYRRGKDVVASLSDNLGLTSGGRARAVQGVAEAELARTIQRSGRTPQEFWGLVDRYKDKPAVLAEVIGQDAVDLLGAIVRRPGTTSGKAASIAADRAQQLPGRMIDDLEQSTGIDPAGVAQAMDAESAARLAAAKPAYDDLYAQQAGVASQRLDQLAADNPELAAVLARADKSMRVKAANQGLPVESLSQMQRFDIAKRFLDDAINDAKARGAKTLMDDLQETRSILIKELDDLTGGAYAAARDVGGENPRLQDAFQLGQKALQPARRPQAVRADVNALNPEDLLPAQMGLAEKIGHEIGQGMRPSQFGVPNTAAKVKAVFGDKAGGQFLNRMAAEAELAQMGSRWAPRLNSTSGAVLGHNAALDAAEKGARIVRTATSGEWWQWVATAITSLRARGFNEQELNAIGDLLLSNPAEGLRRLRIMRPGTATPTGGGIAGANALASGDVPAPQPQSGGNALAEPRPIASAGFGFNFSKPKEPSPLPPAQKVSPQDPLKLGAESAVKTNPEEIKQAIRDNYAYKGEPENIFGMAIGRFGDRAAGGMFGSGVASVPLGADGEFSPTDRAIIAAAGLAGTMRGPRGAPSFLRNARINRAARKVLGRSPEEQAQVDGFLLRGQKALEQKADKRRIVLSEKDYDDFAAMFDDVDDYDLVLFGGGTSRETSKWQKQEIEKQTNKFLQSVMKRRQSGEAPGAPADRFGKKTYSQDRSFNAIETIESPSLRDLRDLLRKQDSITLKTSPEGLITATTERKLMFRRSEDGVLISEEDLKGVGSIAELMEKKSSPAQSGIGFNVNALRGDAGAATAGAFSGASVPEFDADGDGKSETLIPRMAAGAALGVAAKRGLGAKMASKNSGVRRSIFGSTGANLSDEERAIQKAAEAQRRAGTPEADTWREHGWSVGRDEKWRFEIDDSGAKVSMPVDQGREWSGTAAEILDHPELYKYYPETASTKVYLLKTLGSIKWVGGEPYGNMGWYNRDTGEIGINANLPAKEIKSVLIHELGHRVQKIENLDSGANLKTVPERFGLASEKNRPRDVESYWRKSGEVEARNGQNRIDMNKDQRRSALPESTEDVPRVNQWTDEMQNRFFNQFERARKDPIYAQQMINDRNRIMAGGGLPPSYEERLRMEIQMLQRYAVPVPKNALAPSP